MRHVVSILASVGLAATAVLAEEEPDFDDPKVKAKIVAKAQPLETFKMRLGPNGEKLAYVQGKLFTGWAKDFENRDLTLSHWKDGKQESELGWHENGQKKYEGPFKNGKLEGLMTAWHDNRTKSGELTYENDELEGPFNLWHDNGQQSVKGTYKNGKPEGLVTRWDENGKVTLKVTYKDGVKVK